MAALDRLEINRWDINDVSDLISALDDAQALVTEISNDAYLSWAVMRDGDMNVGGVVLYSVEMTDGSFCYEVDLVR